MPTPYSGKNQIDTDRAHKSAEESLYPLMLDVPRSQLSFERASQELDYNFGIDWIVKVAVDGLRDSLSFPIQERFRDIADAHYRDITITEWNNVTNLKSELYKLRAWLFVYGYYDQVANKFGEVIAVNIPSLYQKIATGAIHYGDGHNGRSNQPFIAFTFKDLEEAGVVVWRMDSSGRVVTALSLNRQDKLDVIKSSVADLANTVAVLFDSIASLSREVKRVQISESTKEKRVNGQQASLFDYSQDM